MRLLPLASVSFLHRVTVVPATPARITTLVSSLLCRLYYCHSQFLVLSLHHMRLLLRLKGGKGGFRWRKVERMKGRRRAEKGREGGRGLSILFFLIFRAHYALVVIRTEVVVMGHASVKN